MYINLFSFFTNSSVTLTMRCSAHRYTCPGYSATNWSCEWSSLPAIRPDRCYATTLQWLFRSLHRGFRRFVRQDNLRRVEHGTRYHDALLLTARKLVWQFIALILHPDKVEYFAMRSLIFLFILPSGGTKHKLQIIVHRTIGEQLEILKTMPSLRRNCGCACA